jgi:hypothetical protein
MIDANARRARVLELLRQAVMMQIHLWDLQTRLERAVLDGAEMNDAGSDEVLDHIKLLAGAAPISPSEVYDAINESHVDNLFGAIDLESHVNYATPAVTPDACARYNSDPQRGERALTPYLGQIVRYDHGVTALVKLASHHAGGFHGQQCMGGSTFVTREQLREATDLDLEIWRECAKWRK